MLNTQVQASKVIFLDIDGVITNKNYATKMHELGVRRPFRVFDPMCVKLLDDIIEETKAAVVISSTWRIGRSVLDFRKLFFAGGMGHNKHIIGKTEMREDRIRSNEIMDWVEKNDVERYAVLDDGAVFPVDSNQMFKTEFDIGLTPEVSKQIINYLNQDDD